MLSFALRVEQIDAEGEVTDSFVVLLNDEKSSDSVDFNRVGRADGTSWMCDRNDFNALLDALAMERDRVADA